MPADYKCKVMQLYEQWSRSGNLMKRSNGKLEGPKNHNFENTFIHKEISSQQELIQSIEDSEDLLTRYCDIQTGILKYGQNK